MVLSLQVIRSVVSVVVVVVLVVINAVVVIALRRVTDRIVSVSVCKDRFVFGDIFFEHSHLLFVKIRGVTV